MREALATMFLSFSGSSICEWLATHRKDTKGNCGSVRCLSASTLELSVRLMIVHDLMEWKYLRWRSKCASICLPDPKATIDVGDLSFTTLVESREP